MMLMPASALNRAEELDDFGLEQADDAFREGGSSRTGASLRSASVRPARLSVRGSFRGLLSLPADRLPNPQAPDGRHIAKKKPRHLSVKVTGGARAGDAQAGRGPGTCSGLQTSVARTANIGLFSTGLFATIGGAETRLSANVTTLNATGLQSSGPNHIM